MLAAQWLVPALCFLLGDNVAASTCAGPQGWTALAENLTSAPYDAAMIPDDTKATVVAVQLYLTSFDEINEKHQSFSFAGYFRSSWIDTRLAFSSTSEGGCLDEIYIPAAHRNRIWIPDLFIDNALEVDYGTEKTHLQASGAIYKSTHMQSKLQCNMAFQWFPFDIQTCTVVLMAYSEDASKVRLETMDGIGIILGDVTGNTEWTIIGTPSMVKQNYYRGIPWDVVHLDFRVRRAAMFYIYAHMLPAALFVFVSWTGFFIDRGVAPARVAIAVIPVLIMLNLLNSIYSMVPRLSYMTWMTGYLMMCLAYTAIAAFEYGFVSYLRFQEGLHKDKFQVLKLISKVLVEHEQSELDVINSPVPMEDREQLLDSVFARTPAQTKTNMKEVQIIGHGSAKTHSNSAVRKTHQEHEILDSSALTTLQHHAWVYALDAFDAKRLNKIRRSHFQRGLQRFGIFYTAAQVDEIYETLGLKHDEPMSHAHFQHFLMKFHEPTMDIRKGFRDDPPSLQVDKVMRIGYIISFSICSIGWLLLLLFGNTGG